MVYFQEKGVNTLVTEVQMDVLGCGEAHDGVELLALQEHILVWLYACDVIFRSETHFAIEVGFEALLGKLILVGCCYEFSSKIEIGN